MRPHLSKQELVQAIRQYAGLIPVAIDVTTATLIWQDLGTYHFYEGFFHRSLDIYSALNKEAPYEVTSSIDVLDDDAFLADTIYPTGFIFHAGRCRSTLLTKALARSRKNLVLSEPGILNNIWFVLTENGTKPLIANERNIRIYKNLLLAILRNRLGSHQYAFIKFTSYNIRFFSFIHAVFPDVPTVFLTRDVGEIVNSFTNRPAAWFNIENEAFAQLLLGKKRNDLPAIIEGFYDSVKDVPAGILKRIECTKITAENFDEITRYWNVEYDAAELGTMKKQFSFDSKVEFNRKPFQP